MDNELKELLKRVLKAIEAALPHIDGLQDEGSELEIVYEELKAKVKDYPVNCCLQEIMFSARRMTNAELKTLTT